MRLLLFRSLAYYWRTNLAVIAGVATAVSVLAGALLVGDSVRKSLRDLVLRRLGNTDYAISSTTFFRERLAADLQSARSFQGAFQSACPVIALDGLVTHQLSGRRASAVHIYGVDGRFWKFQGEAEKLLAGRGAFISPGLREELGARKGDTVLVRVEKPSDIPIESLHGRREENGATFRLQIQDILEASESGEFSTRPQQERVRAVFVPMKLAQQELAVEGKANTILIAARRSGANPGDRDESDRLKESLKGAYALADLGVRVRSIQNQHAFLLESDSAILSDELVRAGTEAARSMEIAVVPALVYLANAIRSGSREIPYSLVAALDTPGLGSTPAAAPDPFPSLLLNQWAADDLAAQVGSEISLDYYLWDDGRLRTENAVFRLAGIVPMHSQLVDAELAPKYPGITDSTRISDWNPPFPMDMKRIRPRDEQYWKQYRTAPKAFVSLETGRRLWGSRFGKLTSLRLLPRSSAQVSFHAESATGPSAQLLPGALESRYTEKLRSLIDPARSGFVIFAARAEGLKASRGAADFGEYFLYFSFFLAVSALLLTALFFRLGIEQRLKEIGILQAAGFSRRNIRTLFLSEGTLLAAAGSALGVFGALIYAKGIMQALRTWWLGAVNTTLLHLYVSPSSLAYGVLGGVATGIFCIAWTLRSLRKYSARELILGPAGSLLPATAVRNTPTRLAAVGIAASALVLLIASWTNRTSQVFGFFGAGTLLLVSFILWSRLWLYKRHLQLRGSGWRAITRLGFRSATHRPGRSLLCISLIASATFIIVAVNAFRKEAPDSGAVNSGTGGFSLLAESVIPLAYDPGTAEGRTALGISRPDMSPLEEVHFEKFRLRPGDDASCLNLYEARNPRILAASGRFISEGRFRFHGTLAQTAQERANPWLLLKRSYSDGVIPVIADANSMAYVLHLKLGDDLTLTQAGRPLKLKLVAALDDSLFQKELLMSEENFLKSFPDLQGFRFFLLDVKNGGENVTGLLEDRLADFGFDVSSTEARLAGFHQVENTYLSTFQFLGALGLVLGTFGLATVMLRNVLERRRELALLRGAGYSGMNLALMIVAENLLLLMAGVTAGTFCAVIAILPAFNERGGQIPVTSTVWLLSSVIAAGLAASLIGTRVALRSPLLATLRAE